MREPRSDPAPPKPAPAGSRKTSRASSTNTSPKPSPASRPRPVKHAKIAVETDKAPPTASQTLRQTGVKSARQRKLRLDDYLPYRLSVAMNEVSRLIARAYEEQFGLSVAQWRLVAVLAENGPLTQQDLSIRTVMDKVTVSRAAQGLLDRNLVERSINTLDGRSHLLSLSTVGEELYTNVAPTALAFEIALLDEWSEIEVANLKQQLLRLQRTASSLAKFGFFPTRLK